MSQKSIIECVPNISEGQDIELVSSIEQELIRLGAHVLDVDCGNSANRTVLTFTLDRENFERVSLAFVDLVLDSIDMQRHRGIHPRLGALDVFPFVPLSGISEVELLQMTRALAEKVADRHSVPVFLYEHSATRPEYKALEFIRRKQYEGLAQRLSSRDLVPDFGPASFNPKHGAIIMGVRKLLVAYNLDLDTEDTRIAQTIAASIRSSNSNSTLKNLKSIGWYLAEKQRAQVSCNLTDFHITNVNDVHLAASRLASELGINILGSELVGLIPEASLILAGSYYNEHESLNLSKQDTVALCRLAAERLNLSKTKTKELNDMVLEYRMRSLGL